MNVSTNPKKAFGTKKPGVHFIPPVAILEEAVVMALGAAKYGAFNWVKDPIDATTYIDAIDRHLKQWQTGEDADAESGASHLAHIRACCAILLDAQAIGNLIDDRSKGTASATAAIDRLKKIEDDPWTGVTMGEVTRESKFKVGEKVYFQNYAPKTPGATVKEIVSPDRIRIQWPDGSGSVWDANDFVAAP